MSTKAQGIAGMWIGLILQVWSQWHVRSASGGDWLSWTILLVGWIVFTFGCVRWAQHLGYPGVLGLLGIFSCLGLAVLLVLPNRQNPNEDLYLDD